MQVRTLEAANRKLELQIRQYLETNAPIVGRDWKMYFDTISELRAQVRVPCARAAQSATTTLGITEVIFADAA